MYFFFQFYEFMDYKLHSKVTVIEKYFFYS